MTRPEKIVLGDLLKAQGLLTDEQLQQALTEQSRSGRKLARVIAEAGFASEEAIARALAQKLHTRYVDLRTFDLQPGLVALLPESAARRARAMVLETRNDRLVVGFADPTDLAAFDEVSQIVRREITLTVVTESDLLLSMNRVYAKINSGAAAPQPSPSAADVELTAQKFDIHLLLSSPLDKDELARRLADEIGIEADRLAAVVDAMTEGRAAKIRSEVTRQVADKVAEDSRRAGFAVDIRECLRLVELVEKPQVARSVPCPGCGALVVPEENPECPTCGLLLLAGDEESEYVRKKRIEQEERTRVERLNAQTRKSNEQLLKEEQEQKLREEARAQLELKRVEDLRRQKEAELRKKLQTRRNIQWAAVAVIVLSSAFVAGRWFALKAVQPPPASPVAAQGATGAGSGGKSATAASDGVAHAVNQAGTIELVEGDVQLFDRDKHPRAAGTGDVVNEGDTIVTGKNGEVHLKMRDEGFIAVRPNTDLQVVEYRAQGDDRDKGVFSLAKGSFRSVTGWIGKFNSGGYRIKTAVATMGIRGTDHEPLVIPPGSPDGEAGTYDKVNFGATYIETSKGRVDIPAGKVGFAAGAANVEQAAPRLLDEVPRAYRPTRHEKQIEPRHEEIQKVIQQLRSERQKQVEQVCRKD